MGDPYATSRGLRGAEAMFPDALQGGGKRSGGPWPGRAGEAPVERVLLHPPGAVPDTRSSRADAD